MKTFEEKREQWCIDAWYESFEDYRDSLSISDSEYQEIAELYANQYK